MIVAITVTRIAEAQAASTGFTLNDAADIIIAVAANSCRLGVSVDPYDLALVVAPALKVGFKQELGIIKSVINKTNAVVA